MKTLLAAALMLASTPALAQYSARGQLITGTIRVAKVLCPTGRTCPVPVALEIERIDYPIDTSTWFRDGELRALDGATVQMAGNILGRPVGGGSHAIVESFEPASDVITVLIGKEARLTGQLLPDRKGEIFLEASSAAA